MMFTDDDLKYLKEMIVAYDPQLRLPALVARLDAAEDFCRGFMDAWYVTQVIGPENVRSIDPKPHLKRLEAWRKVAGK